VAVVAGAAVAAVTLVVATGWLFDRMNWPVFHSWALIHGSAFILLPFYFLVCGAILAIVLRPRGTAPP
jgi:hypothetical protein